MKKKIVIAIEIIRAGSFIYLGWLSFQYSATLIDYFDGHPVPFVDFTLTDNIWFITNKAIIFMLYFVVFQLVDFILKKSPFLIELKVIVGFAFVDLLWQITEMVDYWWANNEFVQTVLTLVCVAAFLNLCFFRLLLWKFFKPL